MAFDYDPQNGTGTTLYPFEYDAHAQKITSVDYVVESDSSVFCHLSLENGMKITGHHFQTWNKDTELFKELAHKDALDRAAELGFKVTL